nr:chemotaxis protein CheA [Bowmanella dokdonensis]
MLETFIDEAGEHLAALESALLELENNPGNTDHINLAFRAMHTIKGSAGMVGFDHLSYFTHHLENLFDELRAGRLQLDQDIIQLVLNSRDHIETLLGYPAPSADLMAISETILAKIKLHLPEQPSARETSTQEAPSKRSEIVQLYRITLLPCANAFREGFDLLPVIRELGGLGNCQVSTYLNQDYAACEFDPESCYLQSTMLLSTDAGENAIQEVFIFVQDDWQIQVEVLPEDEAWRVGELLVSQGVLSDKALKDWLESQPKTGQRLSESGLAEPEQVERALSEQRYIRQQQQQKQQEEQNLKVPQRKLDALMDQVGELVILQASLDQLALEREDDRLNTLAEELSRLANGLRDIAFDIRMLPIGSTFGRFRRLVRDLSKDLGKAVELETQGADTELDKVVLDKLVDPLVHILRNSLDHGIETPQVRLGQGKTETGTLKLSAYHHQGQILIEISDDGAGLNRDRILKKAQERGLVSPSAPLDDKDIYQLIFEPGFSTADTISDVSGRGVGMDVVRSSIEALQGKVALDSEPGKGTRIRIMLPMTLSIIEGLMVSVAGQKFVIPLNQVEECIETSASELSNKNATRLIRHREQLVPSLRLRESFALQGTQPPIEQTVIVRTGDSLLGVTVDEVIGNYQTVIRNLGKLYRDTPGVMGATILGDGGIAMILDLAQLTQATENTF